MSSASESPEGKQAAAPDQQPAPAPDEGLPLLNQILEQTLRRPDQPAPQVAKEIAALAEVARRYPEQTTLVQPILEELIDAILSPHLDQMKLAAAARQAMLSELAHTLYDDTPSRERLEALWNGLQEKKP
jgi:hypothetical protein